MPNSHPSENRLVAALLYDRLCTFEFGITAEIFALPRPEVGPDWYRFVTVAEEPGPLRANGGVAILPEAGLERLEEAGTIVIPGWPPDGPAPSYRLREALVEAHGRGTRIVSICAGAYLLAACGLLDGRRAATHWRHAPALQQRHPNVLVDPGILYADEGSILTSAGSAAGIDLLLHIVRKDFGARIANDVAKRLVVPPHRDGDQAQYVERPMLDRPDNRFARLIETVRARPAERWTVGRMADEAAMSVRTFIRRFRESTGMAPGEWLTGIRIEAARYLLETSPSRLDDIALASGFGTAANLRVHFRQRLGVSPAAYRTRFSAR